MCVSERGSTLHILEAAQGGGPRLMCVGHAASKRVLQVQPAVDPEGSGLWVTLPSQHFALHYSNHRLCVPLCTGWASQQLGASKGTPGKSLLDHSDTQCVVHWGVMLPHFHNQADAKPTEPICSPTSRQDRTGDRQVPDGESTYVEVQAVCCT